VEQVRLALNFLDVGMTAYYPEGVVTIRLSNIQRSFRPDSTEDFIDPVAIGIGVTINNGFCK
jgi:hypothetical protein